MHKKKNNAVGNELRYGLKKSHKAKYFALGSLAAGVQAATQFFAYTFDYQAVLGGSYHKIYPTWKIFEWAGKYSTTYLEQLMQAGSVGTLVTAIGLIGVAIAKTISDNSSKASDDMHGSARWADKEDIELMGFIDKKNDDMSEAICIGGYFDTKKKEMHYLWHRGNEHVLTYAPTRSGKGVGLVIPTLLTWQKSAVITDLKSELWQLTSGWRKEYAGNKVMCFEPASSASGRVRWNPLDEIRIGTDFETGDIQNLAAIIVDPHGKGLESHWDKTAFSLLTGVMLHAVYVAKANGLTATLAGVDEMLSSPDRNISELWAEMATYPHLADGSNHPAIGRAARDMLDRAEEEAGSVLSTTKSFFSLYRDPVVANSTSCSDFLIEDLMNDDQPVSLYIVTQPDDKLRLKPLVRVLITMIIRKLATGLEFKDGQAVATYKHRLLAMLDEFPSLGKIDILQESLAYVAGYGITCYLICQDLTQLKSEKTGYGRDEQITSNCHIQNAYPPNRQETAEALSKSTGQTTKIKEQVTTSGKRAGLFQGSVSRTTQEVARPLLTPDECLRLPPPVKVNGKIVEAGSMLVFSAGQPAIFGRQLLFFKDPIFMARSKLPPPVESDKTRKVIENKKEIGIEL